MVRCQADRIRRTILDMAYHGGSVHIACAFSLVEILAVLYRSHAKIGGMEAPDHERDWVVLSKGHGVMAQYACLHDLGWIESGEIRDYFTDGTRLKGLADAHVRGVDVSSGSLGHGLSVAVGLALGARRSGTGQRCFVILGDGEMNEGAIWEALLFAAHAKLGNLVIIVDENGYQAMGRTNEVMKLGSIADKLGALGLDAREVDGHDEMAIDRMLSELNAGPPTTVKALVAHTVKGKGVSFMEDRNEWHYTRLSADTYAAACAELMEPA